MITAGQVERFHLCVRILSAAVMFFLIVHAVWIQDWPQAIFWALAFNAGPARRP